MCRPRKRMLFRKWRNGKGAWRRVRWSYVAICIFTAFEIRLLLHFSWKFLPFADSFNNYNAESKLYIAQGHVHLAHGTTHF